MDLPKALSETLNQFNAASLADGNLAAGTNILAAMCITLSNLLPRGAGLLSPDGDLLPVGLDFLILDGLSRSLIDAKVFEKMARQQAILSANVEEGKDYAAHHNPKRTIYRSPIPPPPSSNIPMVDLRNMLNGFSVKPGDSSPFEALLSPSPGAIESEFKKHPLIFTRWDSGTSIHDKLPSAHFGQLFIRGSLDASPPQKRFVPLLRSIMQSGGGTVDLLTRVALSAPPSTFKELYLNGEADFLSRFLWIYDHPFSITQKAAPQGCIPVGRMFNAALQRAWGQRLDFRRPSPPLIEFDWKPMQEKWVAFLGQQERRFPRISATAYPLFATLLFGLCRVKAGTVSATGALLMAKQLVEKMISLREQLLQNEERARLLRIAMKLVQKLGGRPLSPRELVRRCNKLPISDCREAIGLLHTEKIVTETGTGLWQLAVPVPDGIRKIQSSIIDV